MDSEQSSELRQDLVSGDWIVIATSRKKRPHNIPESPSQEPPQNSLDSCPFEDPQAQGNSAPVFVLHKKDSKPILENWAIQVIPNKYPAFSKYAHTPPDAKPLKHSTLRNACVTELQEGPYIVVPGYGYHEVIIYRDHRKTLAEFTPEEALQVFKTFQARYNTISEDLCVKYILVLHNQGKEAGASLSHPHSQLIAIPVVPPDVMRSLEGSRRYYQEEGVCVHCVMIQWELKNRRRIISENDRFIAFCPYVSRASFEIRIFPKLHTPRFETSSEEDLKKLTAVFLAALKKLTKTIHPPSYNFFIHTSPAEDGDYSHYHWHIEIVPKTGTWGGFEIGTGIEVSSISPEAAADELNAHDTDPSPSQTL